MITTDCCVVERNPNVSYRPLSSGSEKQKEDYEKLHRFDYAYRRVNLSLCTEMREVSCLFGSIASSFPKQSKVSFEEKDGANVTEGSCYAPMNWSRLLPNQTFGDRLFCVCDVPRTR